MGFQIIAIVILLVFYGCYFTKMILQRKKGIQTNQMGKGKTGLVKRIEITMKITSLLVPAAEIVSIVLDVSPLPLWARIAGVLIGICGAVVFILAVVTMRDSWRAGVSEMERTELVTGGIYQISRNPAFLGFDLVYIGIVLMFFNWVLLAVSVFAGLMFHLQIVNVEEDFLVRTFGQAYLDYRKKVNRYLGRKIGKQNG
ncbi:MAG: isoprenylcysteine carboxylmethyltransferase family protein [Lachnospiraceae bacterium]|nr:isoprenylcysteine carboxylmethyltransferase family protein [Lachnospiraceae bacterium]